MKTNDIINALNNTINLAGKEGSGVPANYLENCCAQRCSNGTGSIFSGIDTPAEMVEWLKKANWEEASHPAVAPFCKSYKTTDIPGGCYGMVPVADQPDDTEFFIEDQKNTGKVSLVLHSGSRIPAEETWMILGPCDTGDTVVFTFHPGEPVPRATTSTDELPVGTKLTKKEAIELGFNLAKVHVG